MIAPITLREANAFVERHHRHSKPVQGCKFCISLVVDDQVCGVAIVGRPVARRLDNGFTAEVLRCCTDGTKNACSRLYSAARRAAQALGYHKLITYTLASETGASLKAANWRLAGEVVGRQWSCKSRPRVEIDSPQDKLRWEA